MKRYFSEKEAVEQLKKETESRIEQLEEENSTLKHEKECAAKEHHELKAEQEKEQESKAAHLSELETRMTQLQEENETVKQEKDSLA